MGKKYLAVFDLDGTLFDTSDVNYYAYRDSLIDYGIELDKEYFVTECNGKHYTEFLPILMGTEKHMEEIHEAKKRFYVTNLDKAKENIHLFEIIKSIKSFYHTAVVTTASHKNTLDILNFFGYSDLFEYIVAQEDVSKVKPNPEGFLKAMKHFNMDRYHTVIFEDSDVGVEAARATGSTVIIVNNF